MMMVSLLYFIIRFGYKSEENIHNDTVLRNIRGITEISN
jgi:hypothetical protein